MCSIIVLIFQYSVYLVKLYCIHICPANEYIKLKQMNLILFFLQLKVRMFWNQRDTTISTDVATYFYHYATRQFSSIIVGNTYMKLLIDYDNGTLTQRFYSRARDEVCAKSIYRRQESDESLTFPRLKKLGASGSA